MEPVTQLAVYLAGIVEVEAAESEAVIDSRWLLVTLRALTETEKRSPKDLPTARSTVVWPGVVGRRVAVAHW